MFFVYSLLYAFVLLALLPFEYMKKQPGVRSRWLRERLGIFNLPVAVHQKTVVWIHAVSMGEVISAIPLIKEISLRHASVQVILSTVTDTGQKVAQERLSGNTPIVYLPFDLAWIYRRLLNQVRPVLFVTIETELWPNMLRMLYGQGVPMLVLNGRLSESSLSGYMKIRFFMKRVVGFVDRFCMQDALYGERIKALGATDDQVTVIGNFKFDTPPPDNAPEWIERLKGPVIVAGSTHSNEEELIVAVFGKLKNDFPDLNLIIAPRHPERFREVEDLLKAGNISHARRSDLGLSPAARDQGSAGSTLAEGETPAGIPKRFSGIVVILDSVGELASAYGGADIAVIGGSFVKRGGHNPLEPAFWARPIVCGPSMENFPFIHEFYSAGGAVSTTADDLYETLRDLLQSHDARKAMGEKARLLYVKKTGAVKQAADILERYLESYLPLPEKKPLS